MSSTLDISGTMTFPNAPGGSTTSVYLGSPLITPTSTAGSVVTYDEKATYEYVIAAAGVQVVNFGTLADGEFLYVGADQAITYKLNGGSDVFTLAANGWIAMKGATITALEITSVAVVDVNVIVMIMGD